MSWKNPSIYPHKKLSTDKTSTVPLELCLETRSKKIFWKSSKTPTYRRIFLKKSIFHLKNSFFHFHHQKRSSAAKTHFSYYFITREQDVEGFLWKDQKLRPTGQKWSENSYKSVNKSLQKLLPPLKTSESTFCTQKSFYQLFRDRSTGCKRIFVKRIKTPTSVVKMTIFNLAHLLAHFENSFLH